MVGLIGSNKQNVTLVGLATQTSKSITNKYVDGSAHNRIMVAKTNAYMYVYTSLGHL